MGKVIRKTGFLGMGKPVEEYYCDKCGKYLGDRFFDEEKVYCEPCANTVSFSIVHRWTPPSLVEKYYMDEFFKDTNDGKEKYIDQCRRCNGLTIHTKTPSRVIQEYYQVDHKEPQQKVFKCVEHGEFDENGNVKSQAQCHHSWITVATSKTFDTEAKKKYESMMQNRNYMIEQMFGTDEIDIQYHCFGATHYWCWKCGLYRRLNPQREHLLPKDGVKNA